MCWFSLMFIWLAHPFMVGALMLIHVLICLQCFEYTYAFMVTSCLISSDWPTPLDLAACGQPWGSYHWTIGYYSVLSVCMSICQAYIIGGSTNSQAKAFDSGVDGKVAMLHLFNTLLLHSLIVLIHCSSIALSLLWLWRTSPSKTCWLLLLLLTHLHITT